MIRKNNSLWLVLALAALAVISIAIFVLLSIEHRVKFDKLRSASATQKELSDIAHVSKYYHNLLAKESEIKKGVINEYLVNYLLDNASHYTDTGKYDLAQQNLNIAETLLHNYEQKIEQDKAEMVKAQAAAAPVPAPATTGPAITWQIPILLYHKVPADFEAQLQHLKNAGYTTITMSQVAQVFASNKAVAPKMVAITFDDGFSDQMNAYNLLRTYQMVATFYMIIGGERSQYCIGIERQPKNCGDSYLNWTETKMLANSGTIEIGAHTIDHPNLVSLSQNDAYWEIAFSKTRLEQELGRPVTSFAYPYGIFSSSIIDDVRRAGFTTATTTIAGSNNITSNPLALNRTRNALLLP